MESEDKRRIRDMEETIRMKNKQIHQLLEDVEEVSINQFHIFCHFQILFYSSYRIKLRNECLMTFRWSEMEMFVGKR